MLLYHWYRSIRDWTPSEAWTEKEGEMFPEVES